MSVLCKPIYNMRKWVKELYAALEENPRPENRIEKATQIRLKLLKKELQRGLR